MMTAHGFAGIVAALLTVVLTPALAAEPAAVQWVATPSATLDPLNWPERALRLEVDGEATLRCAYDVQGVLNDCRVMAESPPAFGFGAAALRMAKVFRLQPRLSDGAALTPGEITFPVRFVAAEFKDPRPRWEVGPPADFSGRNFPERALRLERNGMAILKCAHDESGALSQCRVLSETPPDLGFGNEAVRLARRARLRATLPDGSALKAGEITFPVPFRIPGFK